MNINPNPHFINAEEESRAYRAIGRFAVFWGPIELQIETAIICLRNLQKDWDESFPVSFSRKVDEMKDRMREEADLAHIREAITPLVGRSKELHVMRTHIVHSYFQGQASTQELMFGRSDQKRGVSYTEARYTSQQIEDATAEMIHIHDELDGPILELFHWTPGEMRRRNIERIDRARRSTDSA